MFNANNILEALKNYIRARGGQSAANNIAEAVNDLNSIPQGSSGISEAPVDGKQYARKDADWSEVQSGEDIPDEVTNAIETNGMGWTSEEEVPAINITWDGDTDGKETFGEFPNVLCKVSDRQLTSEEIIGSIVSLNHGDSTESHIVSISDLETEDVPEGLIIAYIQFTDTFAGMIYSGDLTLLDFDVSNGTYFSVGERESSAFYVSALIKEALTKETVHPIDEKYIPSPGVIIETITNTTVSGYQVPDPTVEQVTAAYNAVAAARPCTLTDALGKQHFVVNQADTVGDTISISILYYMEMILTYSVENDAVVITHYDIGSVE